jgi:cytochrome c oxidase assembly protein subunit 15
VGGPQAAACRRGDAGAEGRPRSIPIVRLPRLSPATYRRVTFVAAVLLAVIIVTGGAVRLTGSGLGCPDWPSCEPGSLTPHAASDVNAMVEFVNRMFTGLVSIAVVIAVLGSVLRAPRRRDLIWLSLGLVVGVFAQAVLGGLTVLFELQPPFVMAHFLVSLALLADALVLHRRASEPDAPARLATRPVIRNLGRLLLVAATVVVVTGTVVTASGPHGGDAKAKRFAFDIRVVARIHGTSVLVFLAIILLTLWMLRRARAPIDVLQRLGMLLVVTVAQAAIGYAQYLTGIPALLVGFHLAGATAVWAAVVWFYLGLFRRDAPITSPGGPTADPRQALARA